MQSFETFALEILQSLSSPLLVISEDLLVLSANQAGWTLIGRDARMARGRPLGNFLAPVASKVRTPVYALQSISPEQGWGPIVTSSVRYYPRLCVKIEGSTEECRVMNLEVTTVGAEELLRLAGRVFERHPEWVSDGESLDEISQLITPQNHILLFRDVTGLYQYEVHRQELMRNTLDVVVRTLDHYIRNALTPILGYCDLIKRQGGVVSPDNMKLMSERVSRHVMLITALLDALQTVRDIHVSEPLGADATLIDIERDLRLRLETLRESSRT